MVDYSSGVNNPRFYDILLAYKENPNLFADIVYGFLGRELTLERKRRGFELSEAASKLNMKPLHLQLMENSDQRFPFIAYLNLLDSYLKMGMPLLKWDEF